MTTMLVRRTAVILTATHILDVFTLTIPTDVLLPMHVTKLTVISLKDVLLKMIPNAVTIPTSVITSHAILK